MRKTVLNKKSRKILNIIRNQYFISSFLRVALRPVQRVCCTINQQIRMKVWANGATVTYDDIRVCFPKSVGVLYCTNISWRMIRYFLERSNTFFDIGANIGFYSVLAKKVKPGIEVFSYEPIRGIFKKNIAFHSANNLTETGHIVNAAIGEIDGEVEIYLPTAGESLEEETTATLRRDSWQFNKEHLTYKVYSIPLDKVLSRYKSSEKVFIKIDVEDYESGVFRSGARMLPVVKPVIVCEILPREHGNQETINIIESYGYIAFGISSDGLVKFSAQDFIGPRTFTDFLLLHNSIAPQLNYIDYRNLGTIIW